jgi:Na+-driven multidrug efflux pump
MKYSLFTKDHKYILNLALPAIAGLSTQMVVSLVDTAMVGRLPHAEYYLAAMGIGVIATWAVISLFSSLATGTHVLIARAYGGSKYNECGRVLNTSLILSILIGIVVSFIVVFFFIRHWELFSSRQKSRILCRTISSLPVHGYSAFSYYSFL